MSKQISIIVFGIAFLFCVSSLAFAGYKKVKAVGSVETKSIFTKSATVGQKKEALEDAKKKALDKYIAGLDSQRIRSINNFKDELYKNINIYVPEIVTLNDGKWENGYWSVDVEASINEPQIEELVNKYAQANIKKKEETTLAFVFVAREVENVVSFKDNKIEKTATSNVHKENLEIDERTKVATSEKARVATNGEMGVAVNGKTDQSEKKNTGIIRAGTGSSSVSRDMSNSTERFKYQGEATVKQQDRDTSTYRGRETSAYQGRLSDEQSDEDIKATSGSVEKKSEVVKYRRCASEEIEAKVTEVFNKADFDVVPTFDVGIDSGKFSNDFAVGGDISDSTKKEAVDSAKSKGITFLAVAMLDVDREQIDQATGFPKIYVSVKGYILDLRGKFTKTIASVGPVPYSGLGENPKVAKVNALINSGTSAAKDLVDRLRVKEGR